VRARIFKEYDKFAARTEAAFKGAGAEILRAVTDSLNTARSKLAAVFKGETWAPAPG
jgi:hypothetical protein